MREDVDYCVFCGRQPTQHPQPGHEFRPLMRGGPAWRLEHWVAQPKKRRRGIGRKVAEG